MNYATKLSTVHSEWIAWNWWLSVHNCSKTCVVFVCSILYLILSSFDFRFKMGTTGSKYDMSGKSGGKKSEKEYKGSIKVKQSPTDSTENKENHKVGFNEQADRPKKSIVIESQIKWTIMKTPPAPSIPSGLIGVGGLQRDHSCQGLYI